MGPICGPTSWPQLSELTPHWNYRHWGGADRKLLGEIDTKCVTATYILGRYSLWVECHCRYQF
jgi:hypothetical protein